MAAEYYVRFDENNEPLMGAKISAIVAEERFETLTDANGWYLVRVTVTDGGTNSVSRDAAVQVFETTCDLAANEPGWLGYDPFDSDQDCDVDLVDFAAFAAKYLDDISATDQHSVDAAWANYLPSSGGLVNGNFESDIAADGWSNGSLVIGWWHSGGAAIVEGVEAYEGAYAAELTGAANLNTLTINEGYYWMPVGNHSLTLRYKGDLEQFTIDLGGAMAQDLAPTDGSDVVLVDDGGGRWILADASVASYALYEVRFTVDTAGYGFFNIGNSGTTGIGYLDDFQIVLDSH